MKIAQYRGKSLWPSRIIRWLTRGPYSHTAFLFDEQTATACRQLRREGCYLGNLEFQEAGAVVEAWDNGVRCVSSLSDQHTPGTEVDIFEFVEPLTLAEEKALVQEIVKELGKPYDWTDVTRFVTRIPGKTDGSKWFCSELVFELCRRIGRLLFAMTLAWEVSPVMVPRSIALRYLRSETTT